jgi:hypothetical protein
MVQVHRRCNDHTARAGLIDPGARLDESAGAFMDTEAVLKCLDVVIAPNTALTHLAGAKAIRVWVALPASLKWRWMVGREDSPWYPTANLFRQAVAGQWDSVFERMAAELAV